MPTDEHDETSKIEESASALLSTIDAYKKIADSLPISEELRAFRGDIREATAALDSIEEDSTAIDVRLMLQRKYFSKGDSANIKRILRSAATLHAEKQAELNDLIERIEAINSSPITLSLSDGSSIQSNYEIAEKIIYGFYLHADIRKIRSLLSLAPQMKLLATAPYVIERENALLNAYALLTTLGYTPFVSDNTDKAGMLSWSDDASEGKTSPPRRIGQTISATMLQTKKCSLSSKITLPKTISFFCLQAPSSRYSKTKNTNPMFLDNLFGKTFGTTGVISAKLMPLSRPCPHQGFHQRSFMKVAPIMPKLRFCQRSKTHGSPQPHS